MTVSTVHYAKRYFFGQSKIEFKFISSYSRCENIVNNVHCQYNTVCFEIYSYYNSGACFVTCQYLKFRCFVDIVLPSGKP